MLIIICVLRLSVLAACSFVYTQMYTCIVSHAITLKVNTTTKPTFSIRLVYCLNQKHYVTVKIVELFRSQRFPSAHKDIAKVIRDHHIRCVNDILEHIWEKVPIGN